MFLQFIFRIKFTDLVNEIGILNYLKDQRLMKIQQNFMIYNQKFNENKINLMLHYSLNFQIV